MLKEREQLKMKSIRRTRKQDEMRRLHDMVNFERLYKTEQEQLAEKLEKIEMERALDQKRRDELSQKREQERRKELELRIKE